MQFFVVLVIVERGGTVPPLSTPAVFLSTVPIICYPFFYLETLYPKLFAYILQ